VTDKKNDDACGDDDVAARAERAKRIHEQIDALKNPATPAAAPRGPKSPRDFIADQMKGPGRTPKK
jgi:hypothetical protein